MKVLSDKEYETDKVLQQNSKDGFKSQLMTRSSVVVGALLASCPDTRGSVQHRGPLFVGLWRKDAETDGGDFSLLAVSHLESDHSSGAGTRVMQSSHQRARVAPMVDGQE